MTVTFAKSIRSYKFRAALKNIVRAASKNVIGIRPPGSQRHNGHLNFDCVDFNQNLPMANRMRGDRKKQEGREEEKQSQVNEDVKIIDSGNYKPKRIPQLMWRECIKKVCEVDP